MKIQFDANQDYQQIAIQSIVGLFEGVNQRLDYDKKITKVQQRNLLYLTEEIVGNDLDVETYQALIKHNMQKIQTENGLPTTEDVRHFDIEMETGTGKTYVYLRTIFELHKYYNLRKFIIIVPSIPIRAGVFKTLEQTKDHFSVLYPGVNYNYYDYDSGKISIMKDFYRNDTIQIMIMTSQSFNSNDNVINRAGRDDMGKYSLMDYISACRPVMILDEPQSSVSGTRTRAMFSRFRPLFSLYYSATHKDKHSLVYQLSPADAYNQRLVKKIQVVSLTTNINQNDVDIVCTEVKNDRTGKLVAKLLVQTRLTDGSFKSKTINVKKGDDLHTKTNNQNYIGIKVGNMTRDELVKLDKGGEEIIIKVGDQSSQNTEALIKAQVAEAVKIHFAKKDEITAKGVKPLSLIFVDKVHNFLGTTTQQGLIQEVFLEELKKYITDSDEQKTKYAYYFAHKKPKKDTEIEYKEELKETKEDREIQKTMYNLIMKDKETLLSFENPVEFIFSHSALAEGRDNPNVFTLCTLRNAHSETQKRQSIGRGLRIPVNQNGERVYDENLNRLSVVVNQSYQDFCKQYQDNLIAEGYSQAVAQQAENNIENGRPETIYPNKERVESQLFNNFWKAINKKTYYTISLSENENMIEQCTQNINEKLMNVTATNRINIAIADVDIIADNEITVIEENTDDIRLESSVFVIPSIAQLIQEELQIRKVSLSKKTVLTIIKGMNNLTLFAKNPRQCAMEVAKMIAEVVIGYYRNHCVYHLSDETYDVDNILAPIKVFKAGGIFPKEFVGGEKALFEKMMIDSSVEENFGGGFKTSSRVEFFFKLNDEKFKIATPVGNFTPDRGVVLTRKENGEKKSEVYFMIETKGAGDELNLKEIEKIKIACARKHFSVLRTELKNGSLECDWFSKYEKFDEVSRESLSN